VIELGEIQRGRVVSVNMSAEKGGRKNPVDSALVDEEGIVGDSHRGRWHRQISFLAAEVIEQFGRTVGRRFSPGDFAENITVAGIDFAQVRVLDLFRIGDVEIEITQRGKTCHDEGCSVLQSVGHCVMPQYGYFGRVLAGGKIAPGMPIVHIPRAFDVRVITVSDRASAGVYEDRSGALCEEMVKNFFAGTGWRCKIRRVVVPDDAEKIESALTGAVENGADIVLTTGGTGLSPRDLTPDVARNIIAREIPGIMEYIRVKYGERNPNALLSRGVAGITGNTIIFTLPGSSRAVREYLTEIFAVLEHLIYLTRDINPHMR